MKKRRVLQTLFPTLLFFLLSCAEENFENPALENVPFRAPGGGSSECISSPEHFVSPGTVLIGIDESSFFGSPLSPFTLGQALSNAISAYNQLGLSITFSQFDEGNGFDIMIVSSTLQNSVCGQACFPNTGGQPGNTIKIDAALVAGHGYTDVLPLTELLAHEMGHAIGLAHSDGSDVDVMWAGTCDGTNDFTWNGFSPHDIERLEARYPGSCPGSLGAISGASTICQSQATAYQTSHSGIWSNSDGKLSFVQGGVGKSVTVQPVSAASGYAQLKFELCNQTLTKNIFLGEPFAVQGNLAGLDQVEEGALVTYTMNETGSNNGTYIWTIPGCNPGETCWQIVGGGNHHNYINLIAGSGNGYVEVRRQNSCGTGGAKFKYVTVGDDDDCSGPGCGGPMY